MDPSDAASAVDASSTPSTSSGPPSTEANAASATEASSSEEAAAAPTSNDQDASYSGDTRDSWFETDFGFGTSSSDDNASTHSIGEAAASTSWFDLDLESFASSESSSSGRSTPTTEPGASSWSPSASPPDVPPLIPPPHNNISLQSGPSWAITTSESPPASPSSTRTLAASSQTESAGWPSSHSLQSLSLSAYLRFLEGECAAFVTLLMLDSPLWNPVAHKLIEALRKHLDSTLSGNAVVSGRIRGLMLDVILEDCSFPSPHLRNAHLSTTEFKASDDDSDDDVAREIDTIKQSGRRCCSPCCTGAFLVEVMLSVVVNEDVSVLHVGEDVRSKIFRRKPAKPFLFFDVPAVLTNYADRIEAATRPPALTTLIIEKLNLGAVDTQVTNEKMLSSYSEMKRYLDFSWRFSGRRSRPSTDFAMLSLSRVFSRGVAFPALSVIKLSAECVNTRVAAVADRGGHAVAQILFGIGQNCHNLHTLDISEVVSLAPEYLVYLLFRDAFRTLHKYAYLPGFTLNEDATMAFHDDILETDRIRRHKRDDGFCPWCPEDDPEAGRHLLNRDFDMTEPVYPLHDGLYDYIQSYGYASDCPVSPELFLAHCVRVSDLVRAVDDEDGRGGGPVLTPLCATLRRLLLPSDVMDSKAWVLPLVFRALDRVESLGDCLVLDGVTVHQDLGLSPKHLDVLADLEEITVLLSEDKGYRAREKLTRSLKSLMLRYNHWSTFISEGPNNFSLAAFADKFFRTAYSFFEASPVYGVKSRWSEQMSMLATTCPRLRKVSVSVQPMTLTSLDGPVVWAGLAMLRDLSELRVLLTSWPDALGLLEVVGAKIRGLYLQIDPSFKTTASFEASDYGYVEYVDAIPALCPNLERLRLAAQGSQPHALSSCPRMELLDAQPAFASLTEFDSSGGLTWDALQFVWRSAPNLVVLRVAGGIVFTPNDAGSALNEVNFNKDRVSHLFNLNPMRHLRVLDIPLTVATIAAARTLLDALHPDMSLIGSLNIKVSIPESLEGESFGDLVSSVLASMAYFKRECLRRKGEVVWSWKREGILTIILQQQMLLPVAELIDP